MTSLSLCNAATCVLLAFLPAPAPLLSQSPSRSSDEQKLIQIEHEMNEAEVHHDADQMSRYLDDAYVVKSMEGKVFDKSETLQSLRLEAAAARKSGQSQPAQTVEGLKTAVLDGSALATFTFTVGSEKKVLHCQVTDTFLKRTSVWKLVGRAAMCH